VTDHNSSLSVTNDLRQYFVSSAFLEDPSWIRCCSRSTRHRSQTSSTVSASVTHSMLITLSCICHKVEGALCSLSNCFNWRPFVHLWFTLNGLSLNSDKSEAIMFGTGARQRSKSPLNVIDLGDVQIQPFENVRSLGVVINTKPSFDAHINSVCKAANYHPGLYVMSGKELPLMLLYP